MHDSVIGLLVSLCVFTGAMVGMLMYRVLPEHHQTNDTRDIVRLAIGMISILASLVLGLLTASAKHTYDNIDAQLRVFAADIIMLDQMLRDYGPAADPARSLLREYTERAVRTTWPDEGTAQTEPLEDPDAGKILQRVDHLITTLQPDNENRHEIQAEALALGSQLIRERWTLLVNQSGTISPVLLAIMVIWVTTIFASFGLFAPHNATVVVAFLICSLSIGTSIFLILEMDTPFDGVIMVSGDAMKNALAHVTQ